MTGGTAIVTLRRSGYMYEGRVDVAGPWVNFAGSRRLDVDGVVEYRRADAHTWPHASVREIRWIGGTAA